MLSILIQKVKTLDINNIKGLFFIGLI